MIEFSPLSSSENNEFVSNSPRNINKKNKAVSHFVIETENLEITEENSFGPISEDSFRTTSTFTFSGTKKVYAACSGKLLIQPNADDSSLVNLILMPLNQPVSDIDIKYIIYRGLRKIDFFSGDSIVGNENSGSEFICHIWTEFNSFVNQTNNSSALFSPANIGFPTVQHPQNDTTRSIDSFFFKNSEPSLNASTNTIEEPIESAFELPIVSIGMELGSSEQLLGVDIILDDGYTQYHPSLGMQLDLAFARKTIHTINCDTNSSSFEIRKTKESAIMFIDYVAFCGMHCNSVNGKIFFDQNQSPKDTHEDIYSLISTFYNSHRQCIYIQSNRRRSYNFYANYSDYSSNNIMIGEDENTLEEVQFHSLTWPIYFLNSSNSSSGNITLKLLADYNFNGSLLFVRSGKLINSELTNQLNNTSLKIADPELSGITYTKEIILELNSFDLNNTLISNVIRLQYIGAQLNDMQNETNEIDYENEIKQLQFELFESPIFYPVISSGNFSLISGNRDTISYFPSIEGLNYGLNIQHTVVHDVGYRFYDETIEIMPRVQFISILTQSDSTAGRRYITSNTTFNNTGISFKNSIIYGQGKFSIDYIPVIEDTESFYCLSLVIPFGNPHNFFHLGLTTEELDSLIALIPVDASNCTLTLNQLYDEGLIALDYLEVIKYNVGVTFENSLGIVESVYTNSGLFVYGLTAKFLCTKNYSKYY